jgi:LDH2 family malate/lactate/ureidoglycolate dehydrogenase
MADADMITIAPAEMERYTAEIFAAAGAPKDVAERMGRSLVLANLSGHDSHGVIRISQYCREIRENELLPAEKPTILKEGPAWALVDGRFGWGHEAARFSMAQAVERAKQNGVAVVTAVRCNHIGRLGEWVEQAAAAGMLGMCSVGLGQASSQSVAPFGGAGRALSTNPIAMAAPRGSDDPVLLDFATSVSAEGKVRVARDKGAQLPPNTIIDRDGNPTTDPNALYAGGSLMPAAGHKGYALAVMVDVLCLALSGADAEEMHGPTGDNSGTFCLAIDPTVFRPLVDFKASVDRIAARVTGVPPAPGFSKVMLPGDPELNARRERANGIQLPIATWEAIAKDAQGLGVAVPSV